MINPITELPVDLSEISADLRSYLLDLAPPRDSGELGRREPEPAPPIRPPGSFYHRLTVMLRWEERYREHIRFGRSTQSPRLQPILKKIAKGHARGPLSRRVQEWTRQADAIGRAYSVPILPPNVALPVIDKQVAEEFGISARTARRYRRDPRLDAFRSVQPWEVRQWEQEAAEQIKLRRRAAALLTPERVAKGDVIWINGAVGAEDPPEPPTWPTTGAKGSSDKTDEYSRARRAYRLQRRLMPYVPAEFRTRPYWLGFGQPWARIIHASRLGLIERRLIDGQECVRLWDRHMYGGRRRKRVTYDGGEPKVESG